MDPAADGREPRQDRSRATRERILTVGVELFQEGGWDAVSVNEACRRANISAGAFYGRFQGRGALVDAITGRLFEALEDVSEHAFHGGETTVSLEDGIRHATQALATLASLHGATMSRLLDDPLARDRSETALSFIVGQYRSILLSHGSEITHPTPEHAVDFVLRVSLESLSFRPPTNTPTALRHDESRHVEDLAAMVHAFLTHP